MRDPRKAIWLVSLTDSVRATVRWEIKYWDPLDGFTGAWVIDRKWEDKFKYPTMRVYACAIACVRVYVCVCQREFTHPCNSSGRTRYLPSPSLRRPGNFNPLRVNPLVNTYIILYQSVINHLCDTSLRGNSLAGLVGRLLRARQTPQMHHYVYWES